MYPSESLYSYTNCIHGLLGFYLCNGICNTINICPQLEMCSPNGYNINIEVFMKRQNAYVRCCNLDLRLCFFAFPYNLAVVVVYKIYFSTQ